MGGRWGPVIKKKVRKAVVTCLCVYHMLMRLSHGYVTKNRGVTPDDPGKGGWGSPFKKKSGAAIFLRNVMGYLGGH